MTIVQNGITSFMDSVFIQDSTSTVGSGKIGLAYDLSGLIIALRADNENAWVSYFGSSGTIESISTIGTYAAPTAGKIRFREEDSIASPGFYQIMAADAKWAVTNAKFLYMNIQGPGMAQVAQRSQLHPVPSNVIQVLASGVLPLMSGMIQTQADIVLDKTGYIVSVDSGPIVRDISGVIIQRSLPSGEYLTREATNALVSGALIARDVATQGQLNARTIASASYLQQTNLDTLSINLSGVVYQRTLPSGEYATKTDITSNTDWTATERSHIRNRLGIDGSASAPSATPTLATAVNIDNLQINLSGIIDQRTLQSGLYLTRESVNAIISGNIMGRDLATQGQLNARTLASASYLQQTSIDSLQINLSGIIDQRTLQSGLYLTRESLNGIVSGIIIGRDLATQGQLNARTLAAASYPTQTNFDNLSIDLSGVIIQRTLPSGSYLTRDDVRIQTSGVLVGWGTVNQTYLDSRTIAAANYATSTQINAVSGVLTSGVKVVELTAPAVEDIFSTFTIAESYAAYAAAGTPAQLLYLTLASMTEFSISGTTITVKKLDGSTTAATFTMNSSTAPTSRTRAT